MKRLKQWTKSLTFNDVKIEDGGAAAIIEFSHDGGPGGLFVRVQSWAEDGNHPEIARMINRRIRVVIEEFEEGDETLSTAKKDEDYWEKS